MAAPFSTATAHAPVAVSYLQMKTARESFFRFLFVPSAIFESLRALKKFIHPQIQMTNALHNRLLQTIAADDAARLQDEDQAAQRGADIPPEEQWWDHLITHFFQRDETSLFVDQHIGTVIFNVLLNAVEDLPLQTRGRRSFIHSHREQLLSLYIDGVLDERALTSGLSEDAACL